MPGIYEIYVKDHFSAAHALRGYDGNCANMHGHNWEVETYIQCTELNKIGIGVDFRDVKKIVKDVLKGLDHTNLNEIAAFGSINPTSENLSRFLYNKLSEKLNSKHIKVNKITVFESPGCGSSYQEI